MRRYRDVGTKYTFGAVSLDAVIPYAPSVVEPLFDVILRKAVTDDDVPLRVRVNDIYLLFNQSRLSLVGKDSVNAWLSSLRASTPVSPKLSDDDLINLVKSRHIQSMSELMAYSHYLTDNYADKLKAYLSASEPASEPVSEPATEPSE